MKGKRQRFSKSKSRRDFRSKSGAHVMNTAAPFGTMRGGIRL